MVRTARQNIAVTARVTAFTMNTSNVIGVMRGYRARQDHRGSIDAVGSEPEIPQLMTGSSENDDVNFDTRDGRAAVSSDDAG